MRIDKFISNDNKFHECITNNRIKLIVFFQMMGSTKNNIQNLLQRILELILSVVFLDFSLRKIQIKQ